MSLLYEDQFHLLLKSMGIEHLREHRFCIERKFRFDFAILSEKIAFEIEGGVYTNGRHTRGKGFENDCEKYNLATSMGWKVYRLPATWFKSMKKVIEAIKLAGLQKKSN